MNRKDFNVIVEQSFERSRLLLIKKGDEYSGGKDVFHNFNNAVGLSYHNSNVKVAWEMNVKHLQSIKDILDQVSNGDFTGITTELIDEKFGDAHNYFLLIEGMVKEKLTF